MLLRDVEVIDLTQSQSSDESVSLVLDDEYCDEFSQGTDGRYARHVHFGTFAVACNLSEVTTTQHTCLKSIPKRG